MWDTAICSVHVISCGLVDRVIRVVGEVLLAVLVRPVEVGTCSIAECLDVVPCRLAKIDRNMSLGEDAEDLTCHECRKHVILLRLDLLVLTLLDEPESVSDVHAHVVESLQTLRQDVTRVHEGDLLGVRHVCVQLLCLLDVSLPPLVELRAVLDGTGDEAALVRQPAVTRALRGEGSGTVSDEVSHGLRVNPTHEEGEADQLLCSRKGTAAEHVLHGLGEVLLGGSAEVNVLVSPSRLDEAVDGVADGLRIRAVDQLDLEGVQAVDELRLRLLTEADRHGKSDGGKVCVLRHLHSVVQVKLIQQTAGFTSDRATLLSKYASGCPFRGQPGATRRRVETRPCGRTRTR